MALAVAVALAAALMRIRTARVARFAAMVGAVGVAAVFAYLTRSGNPDVDAVERFHFVEYAAVTWLFYRAWIHHRDLSTLVLPVLATFIAGVGDEAFQWFVPGRVGEWRDLGINLAAIASGLLFSVALDPPWRVALARVAGVAPGDGHHDARRPRSSSPGSCTWSTPASSSATSRSGTSRRGTARRSCWRSPAIATSCGAPTRPR